MRAHADNPFLAGDFAPVFEERDDTDLEIEGSLPADLDGTFVRIGPNPRFLPEGEYHWFDGDGMVHAVTLRAGAARYVNRWVRTREFALEEEAGKSLWGGLSSPVDFEHPHGPLKNPANTSVVFHAGRFLALHEAGTPWQMTLPDLETVGPHDFGGALKGSFTAHPRIDPKTGEMFFFGYSPVPPFLRYYVVAPDGKITHAEEITLPRAVMMHDFVLTERHVVFFDAPATMDIARLSQGKSLISWEPEHGTRIGVMDRYGAGADIRWFDVPNCYVYHFYNGWDEGDLIHLYGGRINGTNMLATPEQTEADSELSAEDENAENGRPTHFTIDLANGSVHIKRFHEDFSAFDTVPSDLMGQPTRHLYCTVQAGTPPIDGPQYIGMRKFDLATGEVDTYPLPESERGGELVFVRRAGSQSEDDGYLLMLVHDSVHDQSSLLVVSALDLAAGPIARVRFRSRVPAGFHARWVDGPESRTL